jgi:hypothetical protein
MVFTIAFNLIGRMLFPIVRPRIYKFRLVYPILQELNKNNYADWNYLSVNPLYSWLRTTDQISNSRRSTQPSFAGDFENLEQEPEVVGFKTLL